MKNLFFVMLFSMMSAFAFANDSVVENEDFQYQSYGVKYYSTLDDLGVCIIHIVLVDSNGDVIGEGDLPIYGVPSEEACNAIVDALRNGGSVIV